MGDPLKIQFGGRWDKECKQWVIPMKNFPQLADYLRTVKISIEDNTQTTFKNYNPELTFDQCEPQYCDDMSSCHQSYYCSKNPEKTLVQLYIVNEMCSIKSKSLLIQHYLTSEPFTYDKASNVFKFETLDLNKVLILIKNVCLKYNLPSLHIQIELDIDTIQDYSSFIQSRKSYLKSSIYSNLSDSDSDYDFRLSNDDIEKIQKYASKQSKANDELSKDYYGHKIDEMCRNLQSQKDKMLFRRSKTKESTLPIKQTKNETKLDWSGQDHNCKKE
jgi:predicted DNA binding CopG/RHH family protein